MVRMAVFNRQGRLIPIDAPPIQRSEDEWQQLLSPEQFRILRRQGTERPFCGTLLDNKKSGIYSCAGCGLPLFSSDAKFHSGTGWPSFFQPVHADNVVSRADDSHGMSRDEIVCARCQGHLGHVFEDGPRPTGLRYCLNSESLQFTPSEQVASLADPMAEKPLASRAEVAETSGDGSASGKASAAATLVLAGGCFWCTEAAFEQLDGVLDVESGYSGGSAETANYQSVCNGNTKHAEAIRIQYDPQKINFDRLLDIFFDAHDPTQKNRQGNDVGPQYRSAIFYADERQRKAADAKIRQLNESGAFPRPIATTLEPLEAFYPAESYHQDYARNHPEQPYIQLQAIPKVCKIRDKYRSLLKSPS